MTTRAVSIHHIPGKPQQRRCECDRPVLLTENEPTALGAAEPVTHCAKCGHRP